MITASWRNSGRIDPYVAQCVALLVCICKITGVSIATTGKGLDAYMYLPYSQELSE